MAIVLLVLPLVLQESVRHGSLDTPTPLGSMILHGAQTITEESATGPGVFYEATRAVNIEGPAGVPFNKLVRLTDFGDFRPGLTIEEASAKFGPPARIEVHDSETTAVYDLPTSRIEVRDKGYSSACGSGHRRTVTLIQSLLFMGA